jgi:2,5-dioxopentanoate dehydrogenase
LTAWVAKTQPTLIHFIVMTLQPVLINGSLIASAGTESFQATNPSTGQFIPEQFPISPWKEVDQVIANAATAYKQLRNVSRSAIAGFLNSYAAAIEASADELVRVANMESGLPTAPRLKDVELVRTINQLRLAAKAAESASWTNPIIDTKANIRSCFQSLGPVCVFGPNNFPFAFNSIAGGDFAAAIAAGNPVIGKSNTSHPQTSLLFAKLLNDVLAKSALPKATVQMIYRTSHEDGEKLVSDPRVAATGYTGSRHAGLKLKAAADASGKPFYAELSSINPVVILPGAFAQRGAGMVDEYVSSGLMAVGQFCTNPGLLLLIDGPAADEFIQGVIAKYDEAKPGTLLTPAVCKSLQQGVSAVTAAGAMLRTGGSKVDEARVAYKNTVLETKSDAFLKQPAKFQTEMFGNAVLIVRCKDAADILAIIESLEGNLTGSIYSANDGSDEEAYQLIAPTLAEKVGRLLNDKMPTGVAVSPAMNHGGPYPATAHPNFTAVGMPTSIARFAKLTCFDAVRADRLPDILQDKNPIADLYRCIDGKWVV